MAAYEGKTAESGHDTLNDPIEGKIHYRFTSVPLAGDLLVYDVSVWTGGKNSGDYFDDFGPRKKERIAGEDLDTCYFALNVDLMDYGEQPTHVLPQGFYCNEFLALDPFDINELLQFQRKYGRITGAREQKPYGTDMREYFKPEPNHNVFSGGRADTYVQQLAGIEASRALYETIPDEECVDKLVLNRMSAVSFREAIFAVVDAQNAIKDLMKILSKGEEPITKREAGYAKLSSEYVTPILAQVVPPLELVVEGQPPHVYDLMNAVYIQLARGLLNNEAYRECANPECKRIFTPKEMGRRLDTQYCCSECQERAKRLRYINKHAKAKR